MALALQGWPLIQKTLTVASTGTTATSANFTIPVSDAYTFYLNVTTATAGTLDCVFQTSVDFGVTYVNVPWRFAQVTTTTGSSVMNVRSGVGPGVDVSTATGNGTQIAATGGALILQAVVDPRFMKFTYTIGTGPFAFTLYTAAWPKGSLIGVD